MALLFFGVMLGLRAVLGMPNVTMPVQNSWPTVKLRVSLGTLMMSKKPETEDGFVLLGLSRSRATERPKKAVQNVSFRLW